jgi:hypothetical protein
VKRCWTAPGSDGSAVRSLRCRAATDASSTWRSNRSSADIVGSLPSIKSEARRVRASATQGLVHQRPPPLDELEAARCNQVQQARPLGFFPSRGRYGSYPCEDTACLPRGGPSIAVPYPELECSMSMTLAVQMDTSNDQAAGIAWKWVVEGDGRNTPEWARRVAARRGAGGRRRHRLDLKPHDWCRCVLRVTGGHPGRRRGGSGRWIDVDGRRGVCVGQRAATRSRRTSSVKRESLRVSREPS